MTILQQSAKVPLSFTIVTALPPLVPQYVSVVVCVCVCMHVRVRIVVYE